MGTNYYWTPEPPSCSECERPFDVLHIGKSSYGWCFALHVIPERGLVTLNDWHLNFVTGTIKDEYGRSVTTAEMLSIITDRRHPSDWPDAEPSEEETSFMESNSAERGPRGLLRHRVGRACLSHGDGTYDLVDGDGNGGYGMRVEGASSGPTPQHRYVWRNGRTVCIMAHGCEDSEVPNAG